MWQIKKKVDFDLGNVVVPWNEKLISQLNDQESLSIINKDGTKTPTFKIGKGWMNVLLIHNNELWVGNKEVIDIFSLT